MDNVHIPVCVCNFLLKVCDQNKHLPTEKKNPFCLLHVPELSLPVYISYLMSNIYNSPSALVVAMEFIARLTAQSKIVLTSYSAHKLVLVSYTLALKAVEDWHVSNKHCAQVGGISLLEFNHLEMLMVSSLNWDLFVHKNSFFAAKDFLTAHFQRRI